MARIAKADHPRILNLVDGEGLKVADVAAEYGCTPANIYALCGKLRRSGLTPASPAAPAPAEPPALPPAAPPDLFAAATPSPASAAGSDATATREATARVPAGNAGIGARLAKPGFGLAMRTADGEESLAPFRSLDELLTAVKPILRASARSPDPVWFSVQPIDLAAIDMEIA